MDHYWDRFLKESMDAHNRCGTCGMVLMPDTTKLRLYHEWLQKRYDFGSITQEKEEHEKTLKQLQTFQEESLKLRRELKRLKGEQDD